MAAAAAPEGLGTEEVQASPFPAPPFWFKLYGPQPEGAPAPPPPPPPRQGTFQVFEKPFSLVRGCGAADAWSAQCRTCMPAPCCMGPAAAPPCPSLHLRCATCPPTAALPFQDEPQVPTEPNDMIAREPDGSIGAL